MWQVSMDFFLKRQKKNEDENKQVNQEVLIK